MRGAARVIRERLPPEVRRAARAVRDPLRRASIRLRYGIRDVGFDARVGAGCKVSGADFIRLGDHAHVADGCWLLVPGAATRRAAGPAIEIGPHTALGEGCVVSAVARVRIGAHVLFGPRVWVTDHNHEFRDPTRPVALQGWTLGGSVEIEDGCWLGAGAVIVGTRGLRIGRNSVVGANSVVVADVPPLTVVAGNPARPVRRYDPATGEWRRVIAPGGEGAGPQG